MESDSQSVLIWSCLAQNTSASVS